MSILHNCLYKSSFSVQILDPKTDEPKHTLLFFWDLPSAVSKILKSGITKADHPVLKEYFGPKFQEILHLKPGKISGGADEDLFDIDFENIQESDIKNYDNVLVDVKLDKINYITDVCIFPEDSFWTIKQKIFVATGIPVYRQHLFYLQQNFHRSAYTILFQDIEYPIMKSKDTTPILGITVDYNMNFNRDNIRIRMEEPCTIIDDLIGTPFYLYDIDDFLAGINKQTLATDKIPFDIIYHSMVRKYFPVMDEKMFRRYLENEQDVITSYNLINVSRDAAKTKFIDEQKILTKIYKNSAKYHDKYMDQITVEIVEVDIRTMVNDKDNLEIRNLVDLIQTDEIYIMLDAYVSHNKSKYRVIKNWVGLEQSALEQVTKKREDYFGQDFLVVYFEIGSDVHSLYIYADGTYLVKCGFFKTHDVNFQGLMAKLSPFVTPILDIINNNQDYLFCQVPKFDPKNVSLSKIRAKIKWSKIMSDKQFSEFGSIIDQYINSGILQKREISAKPNTVTTKIIKGMYKTNVRMYLKKGIESSDYYVVFRDSGANHTWNARWGGENMDITNNMINVTFEIFGMDNVKFIRAVNYIFGMIDTAEKEIKQHQITKKESVEKTNKTTKKKFREIDPKLYDMEDEKGTKYARICQKKHRPINIYTDEEYKSLPSSDRKNTYPFINYTTGDQVWYKCTDKMPFLGFIIGKHKDGYCIPKCKKSNTSGIKNKQIWNVCTNAHTINKHDIQTKTHNDNILQFGKILEPGKTGLCHEILYSIFKTSREQMVMTGIDYQYDNVTGGQMIDIIAYQLGISPEILVEMLDAKIDESTWMGLLSASMSFGDFKLMLADIKNGRLVNKIDIRDIMVELAAVLFGVHIILFETHVIQHAELLRKTNSSIHMKFINLTKFGANSKENMRFGMVAELYGEHYPIIFFETDDETKVFDSDKGLGKKISGILRKIGTITTDAFKIFEYSQISKILEITKKYVWNRYVLYVESSDGIVISCHDSINVQDGILEDHNFLDVTKLTNKPEVTLEFLQKYATTPPVFINYNDQIIGCRIGQVFAWFAPVTPDVIDVYYRNFTQEFMMCNPSDINSAIIGNTRPTQKYKIGIFDTYYDMYIYKLFRCEFYKLLMEYRSLATHNKIVDKYKANELMSYLQNNPGDFPYSSQKILNITKYEQDPASVLKTELFIEDILNLRSAILAKPNPEQFLVDTCNKFVVLVDEIKEFPIENILYSHIKFQNTKFGQDEWTFETEKDGFNSLFYENGLVKITKKIYPELIKMLLQDLQNYDVFRYDILNFKLMFIINYLNFRNYDNEKIIIQSL